MSPFEFFEIKGDICHDALEYGDIVWVLSFQVIHGDVIHAVVTCPDKNIVDHIALSYLKPCFDRRY